MRIETSCRMTSLARLATAVALAAVLCACSSPSGDLPVYSGGSPLAPGDPAYAKELQIKYYGAGSVLLRRGPDAIATAPFFSNPSMLRVAFGEIRSRPDQIVRFLPAGTRELEDASAVLVGHAHYDHLMDMPYIKAQYAPRAKIYGSATMRNTLLAVHAIDPADIVSVEESAGEPEKPGKWWYAADHRIRFMAIRSEHAPIILHIKFFEGSYSEPLTELPKRAYQWREGETLAYLIDFLAPDGSVDFRIHYQDAASNPPLGFPPPPADLGDGHRVDVAILCLPGFEQVANYPEGIVNWLRPRFIVGIHWENFFALLPDDPKELRTVPTLHADRFISRLSAVQGDAVFKLPAPGAWMRFPPAR